jgi:hypothetical protein
MVVTSATFHSDINPYVLVTVVLPAPPVHQSLTALKIVASVSGVGGVAVGAEEGADDTDGALEGDCEAVTDGPDEGDELGVNDGASEGDSLGANDGDSEGDKDGAFEGDPLGCPCIRAREGGNESGC